jgi:hypothetical protein
VWWSGAASVGGTAPHAYLGSHRVVQELVRSPKATGR